MNVRGIYGPRKGRAAVAKELTGFHGNEIKINKRFRRMPIRQCKTMQYFSSGIFFKLAVIFVSVVLLFHFLFRTDCVAVALKGMPS